MTGLARLFMLLRDLAGWIGLVGVTRHVIQESARRPVGAPSRRQAPNLRPPTLMIDLLFGALMLFAFQIGSPTGQPVVPHQFDLPTAAKDGNSKPRALLPVTPRRQPSGAWAYRTPDGKELTPSQIKNLADEKNLVPVLIVPKTMSVQNFIDAEQPLRQLGVTVGLAVNPGGHQ